MMKVLVIAAHPDDEVLGCGGTIGKHAQSGDEVYCLILGEGVAARGKGEASVKKEKEALRAAEILGIKELIFKDFPDQRLDTIPLLEVIKSIEEVKQRIKPNIIYTHHQGDLNIDHQITFKAVLTACRPMKDESVKEIYSFEVPSSTEWNSPEFQNYFMPNVFVDISNTFRKKLEAVKAYESETCEYPHPRSPRALEIIARRWGVVVGKELAEAFRLVRCIK
ncbi:MAG: PIG-L family deacetylase [Dehalococcoidales bacterium]|nr:PIG-L family deacetylase [Dehalococcoidales bacterium]